MSLEFGREVQAMCVSWAKGNIFSVYLLLQAKIIQKFSNCKQPFFFFVAHNFVDQKFESVSAG